MYWNLENFSVQGSISGDVQHSPTQQLACGAELLL